MKKPPFLTLAAVLLVLAGLTAARYRSELRLARQRLDRLGSQVIQTACGPIETLIVGAGDPVLVIHGNGGGFDQGLGLAQGYLNAGDDEGFEAIIPSRFGYLRTPLPAGATSAAQADAYACLLDALGIQRVAILTSSAGVTSSVQFALRHPDRVSALVFHSPNAPGEVGLVPPPQPVFSALLHSDFAYWVMTTYAGPVARSLVGVPKGFPLTPALQADVQSALSNTLPISARADGMIFDTYQGNPEINTLPLEEIAAPTLVISAVDDPMALHASARTLAGRIPTARLLAVPDGGHLLLGRTAEVRAEITAFLRGALASR